jgi:hypothetical protein
MADERVLAKGGIGIGGAFIGLGMLALVAIAIFIVMSKHSDQALRTDAVTSAASSLAAEAPSGAHPGR